MLVLIDAAVGGRLGRSAGPKVGRAAEREIARACWAEVHRRQPWAEYYPQQQRKAAE